MQWDKAMYGTLLAILLLVSGMGFLGGLSGMTSNYNSSTSLSGLTNLANSTMQDINKTTSTTQTALQSQGGITQTFSILTDTAVSGVKLMGTGAYTIYTFGATMMNLIGLPSYFATILFIMIAIGVVIMIMTAFTGGRL